VSTTTDRSKPRIIEFPKILDERGNLSYVQDNDQIPFKIARTHLMYDVPGGEKKAGYAHKFLSEVIIALSGSFDVMLHDGRQELKFQLNRSYQGLYVPKLFWCQMENFSTNSLAIILADEGSEKNDYIGEFELFKSLKND
jgi:hypothetical protein